MNVLLFIVFIFGQSEKPGYYVSYFKGAITVNEKSTFIKLGDKLSEGDKLTFSSPKDIVTIIGKKGDSYTIRSSSQVAGRSPDGFWTKVGKDLIPDRKHKILATRHPIIEHVDGVSGYFTSLFPEGQERRYLVVGSQSIPVLKEGFPDYKSKFFFVRYTYQDEVVNKKLAFMEAPDGKSLFLEINESLFSINGKKIPAEAITNQSLMYYDQDDHLSYVVAPITFLWVSKEDLMAELAVIKAETHAQHVMESLYSHIINTYGAIDRSTFDQLCKDVLNNR